MDFAFLMILALGFLLGVKHALDADHVVAVSAIVSENKSLLKSSLVGTFWGIGHTAMLLVVGLLVLLFKVTIPEKVAMGLEFGVGIMLVILGGLVIRNLVREKYHLHKHTHDDEQHLHLHSHAETDAHQHEHRFAFGYKSLAVGMLHGLAGSAALMLMILPTIQSVLQGVLYILIFGAGTVSGMMIISALISMPFLYAQKSLPVFNFGIRAAAGGISVLLGVILMVGIGHQLLV